MEAAVRRPVALSAVLTVAPAGTWRQDDGGVTGPTDGRRADPGPFAEIGELTAVSGLPVNFVAGTARVDGRPTQEEG